MTCLLIIAMVLVGCGSKDDSKAIYTPGTYEGDGNGHAGPIKVSINVSEQKIKSIEFLDFNESEFALDPANQLVQKVLDANSADVDSISGASFTSSGVLEAINAALAQAYVDGASVPVMKSENNTEDSVENLQTDVVIIGAGGAGLTAAIEAASHDVEVIVLEKMPMIGGNTKYATGGLNAAETSVQKEVGIEDSVDLFYEDTMTGGGNINNPGLVEVLTKKSAETVEWLIGIGADLSDVGRLGGASTNRAHRPTGGAPVGNHIVDVLYAEAQEMGVNVLLNSEVIEILGDSTTVSGVKVASEKGEYIVEAKAVIIASGGFGANNELVSSFRPEFEGYGTTNHPGATGDVLEFASKIDVSFIDMKEIQTHPTVMPSNNYMITEAVRGNGAILINRNGERFINEIDTRAVVSAAELEQEGKTAFLFFDQGVRESLSAIDGYYKKGFLIEAQTIEELAEAINVSAETLANTVQTYNSFVTSGEDEDFNRPDLPISLEKAPFYAVEVGPAVHHTMGGLLIDTDGQVYNNDNNVVSGLFAAGEVTGGVHGNNRLGGNALSDITTFGRIVGSKAAEFIIAK